MSLPVTSVIRPALLSGLSNGRLPDSVLVDTPGLAGGPLVRLTTPAWRAWRALCNAATAAGIVLKATSATDSYRPYEVQKRIFLERYTTDILPNRPWKTWGGQRWYQKPGTATAAVPGTSNHGWGLAVDVASASGARLEWLLANADDFGWSWEVQSEPWHIRYWAGDHVPAAVLEHEGDDMSWDERFIGVTADGTPYNYSAKEMLTGTNTAAWKAVGVAEAVKAELDEVHADVAALKLGGVDMAALKAAVREVLLSDEVRAALD